MNNFSTLLIFFSTSIFCGKTQTFPVELKHHLHNKILLKFNRFQRLFLHQGSTLADILILKKDRYLSMESDGFKSKIASCELEIL